MAWDFQGYSPSLSLGKEFNPASNLSFDYAGGTSGGGMDPLTLSALIGGGSKVLEGIFGLFGDSDTDKIKEQIQGQKELAQQQYELGQKKKAGNIQDTLKYSLPGKARYMSSQDMPGLDVALKKAVLGKLGDALGTSSMEKYGLDIPGMLAGLNRPDASADWESQGVKDYRQQQANAGKPRQIPDWIKDRFGGGGGRGFRGPLANDDMASRVMGRYGFGKV